MSKPPWFPDWSNQIAAIVASGPSAKKANIEALRGKAKVIAIKENYNLCQWADVVYGCDAAWWLNANGLPDYRGIRVSYDKRVTISYPGINLIQIERRIDRIMMQTPGVVGSGGNSGFQALNLAVQFGADRIILVGFDMHMRKGVHWYGYANGPGRTNPDEGNLQRWAGIFESNAEALMALEVDVVNASSSSAIRCFTKMSIEGALQEWQTL